MEPIRISSRVTTTIPDRYREERERVLQILSRWETTIRPASLPMGSDVAGAQ